MGGLAPKKDAHGDGTARSLIKMYISKKQTYRKRYKSWKCNEKT